MGIYTKLLNEVNIGIDINKSIDQLSKIGWDLYNTYIKNKSKSKLIVVKNVLIFNHPLFVLEELKEKSDKELLSDSKIINKNHIKIINFVIDNYYEKFGDKLDKDNISKKDLKNNIQIEYCYYNADNSFYIIFKFKNLLESDYKIPTLNIGIENNDIDYMIINFK